MKAWRSETAKKVLNTKSQSGHKGHKDKKNSLCLSLCSSWFLGAFVFENLKKKILMVKF